MMTPDPMGELKRRFPLPRYFKAMGYEPKPRRGYFLMHCPFSIETGKPKFRIYLDRFQCMGCGKTGDIITAHQEIEGMPRQEAYEAILMLADFYNNQPGPSPPDGLVGITTLREIRRTR